MNRCWLFMLAAWAGLGGSVSLGADAEPSLPPSLASLFRAHCLTCHGEQTQEAGLRLDTLPTGLGDPGQLDAWVRVYDKLRSGEMPPPGEPRLPEAMLTETLKQLEPALHAASLEQQRRDGRVVVRRLNATEYEHTVHDLLDITVPLKEMLPEENGSAGFDNVSAILDLSATHLLLYQEAAERAIAATIPPHPPLPFHERRSAQDMVKRGPNFQQTLNRSCRFEGDGLIVYSKLPRYGLCSSLPAPTAGRYRVRVSLGAVGGEGKPVPAAFMTVEQSGREEPVLREMRDIPHGPARVIEFDFHLNRRQSFVVNLLKSWDIRQFKRPIEEYDGPGLVVEWIEIEGPLDPFPPPRYERLFSGVPLKARSVEKDEREGKTPRPIQANRSEASWLSDPLIPASESPQEDAERLIRAFLPRAFRRPVDDAVVDHYVARVHAKLAAGYSFYDAMTYGYKAILSSPHFLLLIEPGLSADKPAGDQRLDDYALAARLSYFLNSSLPDEELLEEARRGRLSNPQVRRAQVERLLNSPRAERFTRHFTGQWLDLRKIDATIPDPQLYGDFDGTLLWSMPRETYAFFDTVLRENRSLLDFVDSDWSILNARLATLYGIEGVEGNELRKVQLPAGSHRGGVMTQASVLKVTADGTRTSPVLRGKWVLERILGLPPAPPPPDVPAIEPDIRGATTIREQLAKHRDVAACATCHVHIDPPGFALESFDPIGGYREFYRASARTPGGIVNLPGYTGRAFYRGPDVQPDGETHDGRKFQNIEEYKQILLSDPDQLARNLVEKVVVYATGADLQFADREPVEAIVARLRGSGYGFRSLIHEVVESRMFLYK